MNRVVVVAPHPDDEIIGCGGTLLSHKKNGDKIFVLYLTNGEYFVRDETEYLNRVFIRKNEAKSVCEKAGFKFLYWPNISARSIRENYNILLRDLVKIFQVIKPNYIYMPHDKEKDMDHVLCHNITKEAYWLSQTVNENNIFNFTSASIFNYEIWSPQNLIHKCCNITEYIDYKIELINTYKSQTQGLEYSEGIKGLNKYRASFSGIMGYAEAFTLEAL